MVKASGHWESVEHRCAVPDGAEIRAYAAGVGSIWACGACAARWRLIAHDSWFGWFNLSNESKRRIGDLP